jgi:hypothetical protein
MTVKLLDDPRETGENVAEVLRENPGAIGEMKTDALRYLMEGGHPIEQATPREGYSIGRRRRVV